MNPLGVYISVPFCRAKCTYCNFASGVSSVAAHQQYVSRLCEEIGSAPPATVDSIYLGGGTPSVLSPALIAQLTRTLRERFSVTPDAEITLECAPGQLDDAGLAAMLELGVNRISFGVQSLVDREAAATGRFHTREVVLQDIERMRAVGIHNLSIDLIAGMPHQTMASWQESLQVLAATGVPHASVYMLEIDDDSRLGRELIAGGKRYHAGSVPNEELTADLYQAAIEFLAAHGLPQYEISNFGAPSRHNLKYWYRQPYLGFGLDAHSMLRSPERRFSTTDVLADYLQGAGRQTHHLSPAEALEEAWFLGLRLNQGVSWQTLTSEFGADLVDSFRPVVRELCNLELATEDRHPENQDPENQDPENQDWVRLTQRGILFSNEVFARFLGLNQLQPIP
jgi:oxygen-independent coproporphyrinogen-3 oxidase